MNNGTSLLGYILIVIGILSVVFTVFIYFSSFTLMEHLSAVDQYVMAAILAALFIGIGILLLKQQTTEQEDA